MPSDHRSSVNSRLREPTPDRHSPDSSGFSSYEHHHDRRYERRPERRHERRERSRSRSPYRVAMDNHGVKRKWEDDYHGHDRGYGASKQPRSYRDDSNHSRRDSRGHRASNSYRSRRQESDAEISRVRQAHLSYHDTGIGNSFRMDHNVGEHEHEHGDRRSETRPDSEDLVVNPSWQKKAGINPQSESGASSKTVDHRRNLVDRSGSVLVKDPEDVDDHSSHSYKAADKKDQTARRSSRGRPAQSLSEQKNQLNETANASRPSSQSQDSETPPASRQSGLDQQGLATTRDSRLSSQSQIGRNKQIRGVANFGSDTKGQVSRKLLSSLIILTADTYNCD